MANYFISLPGNEGLQEGTIHDPSTKLKVKSINLRKRDFKPSRGEVRYFVTSENEELAFETKGYNKQRKLLILQMIAQYCVYLGLIEAQIHTSLPI